MCRIHPSTFPYVGQLDPKNSVLVDRGYSRESVIMHALVWNFLTTGLKSKSDKNIWHRCTSPRGAWDGKRLILTHGLEKRTTTQTFKLHKPGKTPLPGPFVVLGSRGSRVTVLNWLEIQTSSLRNDQDNEDTPSHHHPRHDHHQRTDRSQAHIRPRRRRLPSAEQRPRR